MVARANLAICGVTEVYGLARVVQLLQILMIKAYGRSDDRIGGGKDGDKVQSIEDHSVADGKSFSLADERDAGRGGKLVTAAGVIEHGETIIIALHEDADDRRYPTDKRDKSKDQQTYDVHGLPEAIADGEADAANHVLAELAVEAHLVFLAVQPGVCLFAEIGEERRADNQHQIFKKRKPEENKDQVDHQTTHHKEIIQHWIPLVLEEAVDPKPAQPRNHDVGRTPEKIKTDDEQDRVQDTRNDYPFPHAVGPDEVVCFCIGLEGYNDFF